MVNFLVFVCSENIKNLALQMSHYFGRKENRLFVVVVVDVAAAVVSSSGTCVLLQRVKSKVGWGAGLPNEKNISKSLNPQKLI